MEIKKSCHHNFKSEKITKTISIAKQEILIKDAPAKICRDCGEVAINGKYILDLEKKLLARGQKNNKSFRCDDCDGMAVFAVFDFTIKRHGQEFHFEKVFGHLCQKCSNGYIHGLSAKEMELEIEEKMKDSK